VYGRWDAYDYPNDLAPASYRWRMIVVPLRLRFDVGVLPRKKNFRFLVGGGHADAEKPTVATAERAMPRRSKDGGQVWRRNRRGFRTDMNWDKERCSFCNLWSSRGCRAR
jgi:hypothetical protein